MSKIANIGEIIRELRKDKKLTQEKLGEMIGCTKATISKIENGEQSPTLQELCEIAKTLGADLSYILGDALETEDYQVETIKYFIKKIARIAKANEYYNKIDKAKLYPEEFIYSLFEESENTLIIQMDKNLLDFAKAVAEIVNLEQQPGQKEYNSKLLSALCQLNKSKPDKEVSSYCLASIQDIERISEKIVEEKVKASLALQIQELQAEQVQKSKTIKIKKEG